MYDLLHLLNIANERLRIATEMVPDVEDFFGFKMETVWYHFRISSFYFPYTNVIIIIFCSRLNIISCVNYRSF